MLTASIKCQNDYELDLLLMLVEHFQVVSFFALILAPLLIQPWHNFHDRIARLLMNEKNPDIVSFLFRGATYYCKNLDYQSDYKEFNRKCMYGLRNIGTIEAVSCLNELCKHEDKSNSALAKKFL